MISGLAKLKAAVWASRAATRAVLKGLGRKAVVLTTNESRVSSSCQIPDIRRHYCELGLTSNSGIFVEVGGYDGESFSNTSFLADQGWRGIYIEPVPSLCKLIKLRHMLNRVTVEPLAVSKDTGTIKLFCMEALTTTSQQTKDAYGDISWAQAASKAARTITVRSEPLNKILERNDVPLLFDLLIVDVEGGEEPVIENFFASRWRAKVLIVELNDLHPDFDKFPALQAASKRVREMILANGYRQTYADGINTIFQQQVAPPGG